MTKKFFVQSVFDPIIEKFQHEIWMDNNGDITPVSCDGEILCFKSRRVAEIKVERLNKMVV